MKNLVKNLGVIFLVACAQVAQAESVHSDSQAQAEAGPSSRGHVQSQQQASQADHTAKSLKRLYDAQGNAVLTATNIDDSVVRALLSHGYTAARNLQAVPSSIEVPCSITKNRDGLKNRLKCFTLRDDVNGVTTDLTQYVNNDTASNSRIAKAVETLRQRTLVASQNQLALQ